MTFLKVDQCFNFVLALPQKLQFQFKKLLFFIMKMTELAYLFLFRQLQSYQIGQKLQQSITFCGIFKIFLAFL